MTENSIVEINVGGVRYATTLGTLTKDPNSILTKYFSSLSILENTSATNEIDNEPESNSSSATAGSAVIYKLDNTNYFIDRDGLLFRYILDYLRNGKLVLPDNFREFQRLKDEAKFYKLHDLAKLIKSQPTALPTIGAGGAILPLPGAGSSPRRGSYTAGAALAYNGTSGAEAKNAAGYITVGYRGTFAFGRDGQADVKFRKMTRILVCGRAGLCKEVFGDTLNESRDPDRGGENRYTSRLFLKHVNLEWAFDVLGEHGFGLSTSCASGTCSAGGNDSARSGGADGEEQRWNHYNEFVFYRPNSYCSGNLSSLGETL